MPVVTSARVGLIERTGVPAREKLRIPAAASARPIRISEPPMIQWTRSIPGTGNGKRSRRSETKPIRRAARKRRGGRAMTPAVPVSVNCCPAGSIAVLAPADAAGLRSKNSSPKTTTRVSFCHVDNHGVNWRSWYSLKGTEAMAAARHRTGAAPRTGAGRIVDSKAEAIAELMLEVAQCFFRIRALGQKTGLITSWGGGAFGFMRSLALLGPLTVPQIAQMRPTSRQRMQRLAGEVAAGGLVTFIDNPKHRRSKLVQLTPKGDARYRELNARLLSIASTMGIALSEADTRKTIEIVRHLSDDVKARSERLS